jgi:small-conductance mechanosensitive channel
MSTVFILENQYGQYLNKQSEWLLPANIKTLFSTVHKDEALNTLVENNSQNVTLRVKIIAVECDEKGRPIVPERRDDFESLPGSLQLEQDRQANNQPVNDTLQPNVANSEASSQPYRIDSGLPTAAEIVQRQHKEQAQIQPSRSTLAQLNNSFEQVENEAQGGEQALSDEQQAILEKMLAQQSQLLADKDQQEE